MTKNSQVRARNNKSSPECAALLSKWIPLTVTVKDHAVSMVTESQLTESAAELYVRDVVLTGGTEQPPPCLIKQCT